MFQYRRFTENTEAQNVVRWQYAGYVHCSMCATWWSHTLSSSADIHCQVLLTHTVKLCWHTLSRSADTHSQVVRTYEYTVKFRWQTLSSSTDTRQSLAVQLVIFSVLWNWCLYYCVKTTVFTLPCSQYYRVTVQSVHCRVHTTVVLQYSMYIAVFTILSCYSTVCTLPCSQYYRVTVQSVHCRTLFTLPSIAMLFTPPFLHYIYEVLISSYIITFLRGMFLKYGLVSNCL